MSKRAHKKSAKKTPAAFAKELSLLNPEQRIAVDQIEGPVLVIAGPGTGKTHILGARIGKILLETDTLPANILCLTFTDAGVHAMRERLLSFIGPEAHRVHIYTFHSFCNKIIQDHLELFGQHELEPLSDLERVELARRLIDELPTDHLLRRKSNNPYFYERHLRDLFKRMKAENWSVEYIEEQIQRYIKSLPEREEFIYKRNTKTAKKGELKTWMYEKQVERMTLLKSAVKLFPRFVELMQQSQRYDYEDMILWVLQEFERNEGLLRSYQEQYLYLLVDEYQDTNGAQNQIVRQLIDYWENPNIFIVGDDDQSIYEFQGARLQNLMEFHQHYADHLKMVLLKENYRSSQNILDASKALIDYNENRVVNKLGDQKIDKNLHARHKEYAQSDVLPQLIEYPNRLQEEMAIVEKIENLYHSNFPLNEIAVIYARHQQARNLIKLLEKKNIPYNTKRQINILDLPMIQNLRLLLQYIHNEFIRPFSGEQFLFKILYFEYWGVLPKDIASISIHLAQQDWKARPKWRSLLSDEKALAEIPLEQPEALLRVGQLLESLIGASSNLSVTNLLERIFNHSGLLRHLLRQDDQAWQLTVLKTFFDFAVQEADRNPRLTLRRLLDIFEKMDDNRLPIGVNKAVFASDGVNLITAHSSKGLEFQKVFLLDCIKDYWEPGKGNNSGRFAFPDTLTFSGEEDALEARRRLFYVAMTRAKESLQISYCQKNAAGKPLQRVQFIDEILQSTSLEITHDQLPKEQLLEAQMILLLEQEKPRTISPGKAQIDALLEGFNLSISSMNTYLRCPLSFFYEYVLQVPVASSEAAAYGTAIHYALSTVFEKMKVSGKKGFPELKNFLGYFSEEMKRQQGYFSQEEYLRRLEIGRDNLTTYYKTHIDQWPKKVIIEFNIRNVEIDGVPVIGTIDRIDLRQDNEVHIVDYKTGFPKEKALNSPTPANPHGGYYWRQLIFYKILYEAFQKERSVQSAEISWLEPNGRGELVSKSVHFTAEEARTVKRLIRTVYDKIMEHDFYEGCGEESCPWCGFVRHNVPADSLADIKREELDDIR